MIKIGHYRLEQLAFDRYHSIDLTFDYFRVSHKLPMKRFHSNVIPCIIRDIKSL